MKIYLVGGAVRDGLLGLPVKDRDWVVVGGDEATLLAQGYTRLDGQFPVFLHPDTREEYALARRETKQGIGYKGFVVESGSDVSLEEDLQRRDFTLNAMAQDPQGRIIDPYGGQNDLRQGLLRHVSPAFIEDPVRLLRAARFVARLAPHGIHLAHDTYRLMKQMATAEELAALKPERVWQEMKQALAAPQPWRFFEILQGCGALGRLLPGLSAGLSGIGIHDEGKPPAAIAALKRAVDQGAGASVRFATLFQDCEPSDSGLSLPVERDFSTLLEAAQGLKACYPAICQQEPAATLEFLVRGRALQQADHFDRLCQVFAAWHPDSAQTALAWLAKARSAVTSIDAGALQAEGYSGPGLGQELERRRLQAIAAL